MATNKRINGDYIITSTGGANTGVIINTNTLTINGDQEIFGGLETTGNITSQQYVSAQYFLGDGQFLSNVTANIGAATILQNGTSNVAIPATNGNVTVGVNLIGNVLVISTQGANITTGTISTSNITGALKVTGGIGVAGNVYADAVYSNNAAVLTANSAIIGGTY
jgi:hypothetical protein